MKQNGRKSKSAQLIPFPMGKRHPPPEEMSEEQALIWCEIINKMPSDYFAVQNLPLLSQYCRHSVQSRRIDAMIEKYLAEEEVTPLGYDLLLKMQGRETACLCSLATKMRISQSALDDHKGPTKANKASSRPIYEA